MENSGNICQSSQKADSRWPNMMSGSEAAAALLSFLSLYSILYIIHHRLWSSNTPCPRCDLSFLRQNQHGRPQTPPQTLEILGFLRWCCSGEFSNRSAIYFCAWVRGWETSKEFDYSIMCLSQKGAGAWAAYARGIATRLNLLSLRGWCHFSPLCHSSLILIPQYVHLLQCFNGYCEMHKHSHWIKPQVTVQCGLRISQLLTHVSITSSVNYS